MVLRAHPPLSAIWCMYNHKPAMLSYPFTPTRTLQTHRLQKGISLVELLVGLTIGLLIVVAAMGSLVATQMGSGAVADSARLQQRADSIFRQLGYYIQQAGAINLNTSLADPTKVSFSTGYTGFDPAVTGLAGQVVSVHGLEDASLGPDTLRISYQDSGVLTELDCLGKRPAAAQVGVRMDHAFSVSAGQLMCKGADTSEAAQAIADGVVDFQVTYGVQSPVAGALQYQFFTADQITDWTNIQAVNICIELIGELAGQPQTGASITRCKPNLLASTPAATTSAIDSSTTANKGKTHKVYVRTFSIRNALL